MSIIACTVTAAREHENAERLRVYQVEAPGVESTQIIANKDHIYDVGDVVAAALVGTVLADGTVIEKAKVRGVMSFGMLLGKEPISNESVPGTDLTVKMGATHVTKQVDESSGVVEESAWPRYTSIDGFLRIKDEILACEEVVVTEKLHGSSVRFGYHGTRPYMVGTHTSRILDSRLDPVFWPVGHLVRKTLDWCVRRDIQGRVATYRARHPDVQSLAVFGEVNGWKCSDLHYGYSADDGADVRLFGEVAINGRFLDYDAALDVIAELFPEGFIDLLMLMVPVLYRGKPDAVLLKQLRDQLSAHAASRGVSQISEGVVIRPTRESISKTTFNRLIAKYKSPLYEERASLRNTDPDKLPAYVTVYDLLADFTTDERVRHVIAKAQASGMVIEKRRMRDLVGLLYADIRKESVGEWPAGDFNEVTVVKWLSGIAGDAISRAIDAVVLPG